MEGGGGEGGRERGGGEAEGGVERREGGCRRRGWREGWRGRKVTRSLQNILN